MMGKRSTSGISTRAAPADEQHAYRGDGLPSERPRCPRCNRFIDPSKGLEGQDYCWRCANEDRLTQLKLSAERRRKRNNVLLTVLAIAIVVILILGIATYGFLTSVLTLLGLIVVITIICAIAEAGSKEGTAAGSIAAAPGLRGGVEDGRYGPLNRALVCPHCQATGTVQARAVREKKGISGAKATGALLTGGVSILATGLSRKEKLTRAHCNNCKSTWTF